MGNLSEAILLRSSGHGIVDQALIEAVRRAAPYGRVSQSFTGSGNQYPRLCDYFLT